MNRRLLALFGLGALVVLAGCLGGSGPSDDQLQEDAEYDWDTTANGTIRIGGDSYTAVYEIHNTSTLSLHQRDMFNNREPLPIRALQFRYPDGTVVDAEAFEVSRNAERIRLELPNRTGKLAYTVEQSGKTVQTATFVDGSYEVVLPPKTDVGVPILSNVSPGGYETETIDGRVHITWDDIDSDELAVEYYLERDLWLFGGLFALLALVGLGGGLYYWFQIRTLQDRREEVGLDVEDEDDDLRDEGPPPGMGR
ncbi:DUF5803 family protein [Halapricum hydrolyticum]|uniref:DUF5803 family protein n=1 Tax=Halapricum hydrolyticum TaxID=2979991 RepID=A0AAE3LI35_9EURY|nr:DUF5803 family protein [Halapricum hydrolyticum]MCU4716527.1 DUF5803 family protein [Halapricum hydrolyticum]MCU4725868.1 DUF5803 family protein [Halapricum hydrolyticum]